MGSAWAGVPISLTTRTLARAKGNWQRFTTRHNKGGYLLFADGHVAQVPHRDVITASLTRAAAGSNAATDFNKPGYVVWNPYRATGR